MAQDNNEATRVMGAGGTPPEDRTMVAGSPPGIAGTEATGAGATQMGAAITCAVCGTSNPGFETYCSECGFLLASAPGQAEPEPEGGADAPELVETASGRRFALRPGVNTVGRENCDILLMDGTVSRRHAQVAVENGSVTVTDLGSTNGTQVDGQRITAQQPTPLASGATLRFGNAALTLSVVGQTVLAAAPAPADPTLAVETGAPSAAASAKEEAGASEVTTSAPVHPSTPSPESDEEPLFRLAPVSPEAREIRIPNGVVTIGRRAGNTVVISDDPYVSGRHAEITCDATGCYLADLGSTNGSVVNGERLEPGQKQLLLDGDELQIGQATYRFETLELPEEDEEEPENLATEGTEGRGEANEDSGFGIRDSGTGAQPQPSTLHPQPSDTEGGPA